jgi:2-epi-5-epi-valiolone synthase
VARLRCGRAGEYRVDYAAGLLDRAADEAGTGAVARRLAGRLRHRRVLLVSTPSVTKLYGDTLTAFCSEQADRTDSLLIERTEATKGPDAVLEVMTAATDCGLGRDDLLLAFGGGICCDLVTVAAAGYRRGIGYICLPTTLVAQIDAGIGLKGAVNLGDAKSRWGSFHPPEAVFADPGWLASLPPTALRHGAAEMIKVAAVADAELFERFERILPRLVEGGTAGYPAGGMADLLDRCAAAVLGQLALNPYERGGRARLLDYGHTFSPVVEERSGWSVPHGEAVAVDLVLSGRIGAAVGATPEPVADRVQRLVARCGLPTGSPWLTGQAATEALEAATAHRGGLHLVVPGPLGQGRYLETVPEPVLSRLI